MKARLLFLLTATLLLVASCSEATKQEKPIRKVKCVQVTSAPLEHDLAKFPGKVVAASDVNLSFRIAGVVDKVVVKEGDYIGQGDVIALLDKRDYELQLEATEAEYRAVEAESTRVIALYENKSVSENDYDKAVSGLQRITVKRAAHQNALNDTQLRAPFDGVVQAVNFGKGEAVAAGTPIVSFISAAQPEVVINIPATNYIKRNEMVAATAAIELYPDVVFPLQLVSTSPKGNLNQLYTTRFVIEQVEGIIPTPSMTAMVTLSYQEPSNSYLAIPFGAVVEQSDEPYVWVVGADSTVSLHPIEIHQIKSNGTAIVSAGLQLDQTVVSAGVNSLKSGEMVSILAPASKSNVGGVL